MFPQRGQTGKRKKKSDHMHVMIALFFSYRTNVVKKSDT